ncbi:MbtH family NRPS accessory protein [Streptomyces sp. NEAU-Y11]|uniref:MbtH family NRPS accessory protein n=1 Tax=Streptomyces cucumeris TaxID=2962890 RepID=UPI0020C8B5B0|nr:MbtH family NRPS accessory protein [Streptomyces sp. NEAU-Y11]MCP9211169.1 MbtH family NRPS accessory protein [Streptomyces sp. NEAU-Y11]
MTADAFAGVGDSCPGLRNEEFQHSLWPMNRAVPGGWQICSGPSPYQGCMEYIRDHWTDMRPAGLSTVQILEGPRR